MPRFKVYLGRTPKFSVSSVEKAKALALPLSGGSEAVRIESQETAEAWVYNEFTGAWDSVLVSSRGTSAPPES